MTIKYLEKNMDFKAFTICLNNLKSLLEQLRPNDYVLPIDSLSQATVGEHTRHIIELFQCLIKAYDSNVVDYDKRVRDLMIQTNPLEALHAINDILSKIEKPNKELILHYSCSSHLNAIPTNYYRELIYNLEHCIHHQALIKVAVFQFDNIKVSDDFGVAPSTLAYRKQCVQ